MEPEGTGLSIGLSETALRLCEHYRPMNCQCPIHHVCTGPIEWSQAGMEAWRNRVNEAAEAETTRKDK